MMGRRSALAFITDFGAAPVASSAAIIAIDITIPIGFIVKHRSIVVQVGLPIFVHSGQSSATSFNFDRDVFGNA
jgi:hypothetical protein